MGRKGVKLGAYKKKECKNKHAEQERYARKGLYKRERGIDRVIEVRQITLPKLKWMGDDTGSEGKERD